MQKTLALSLRNLCRLGAIALVAFGLDAVVLAASFAWTGGGGNANWDNPANWNVTSGVPLGTYPGAADDVTFPTGAVYTNGVSLNGLDREANSLTYATTAAFTLAGVGNTLSLTSGTLTRQDVTGDELQHIISCNLSLPAGTHIWNISGIEQYNNPTREMRITGSITTLGTIVKTGNAKLALANSNSFGAMPVVQGGVIEVNGVTVADALGTGDLELNATGSLFIRGLSQTIANNILTTGSGIPRVATYGATATLTGDYSVAAGKTLQLGHSGSSLILFEGQMVGDGNLSTMRSGVVFSDPSKFPSGNLAIGTSGGNLLLDGISWSEFTTAFPNGYGSGAGQWQLGGGAGFAARGEPLVIDGSGAVGGGADAKTWFNRALVLGGTVDNTTRLYANTNVTIQVDTELNARRDWNSSSAFGPGMIGTHNDTAVNRFEGDITDQVAAGTGASRGALRFTGAYGNDELVLAGLNNLTGSYSQPGLFGTGGTGDYSVNTGRGGMVVFANPGGVGLVHFDGQGSLPTGNGGGDAWLAGVSRSGGTAGFLLAAKDGGETYQLASGMRFLLGSSNNLGVSHTDGVLGASGLAGASATLRDSAVCIQSGFETGTQSVDVLVRGPITFNLGVPGAGNTGAVLFQPTWGWDAGNFDTGIDGTATVVQNSAASRTIRVRGDGTAVLGHVAYTQLGGSGDTSGQFRWQVGTTANSFNGALRETGTTVGTSTAALPLILNGGVLELGATDLARNLGGSSPAAGEIYMLGGGGFAAFGGDRIATLNGGANLTWGSTAGFVHNNNALIFGSRTADSTVEFTNNLNLNNGTRQIMVVRGVGDAPEVRLTGTLSNGNLRLVPAKIANNSLIPTGTLELAGVNTFTGTVAVEAGTLRVTGSIASHATNAVTVWAGATLEGTGTILRPVTINSGATLAPGTSIGSLTVGGNLTLAAGSVFEVEIDGVGVAGVDYDQLVVTNNSTIQLGGATLALTFGTGFAAQLGDAVFIIDNAGTGSTLGTFQYAEGEMVGKYNGRPWIITYLADYGTLALSGGNDVALYAIPEPASLALLALAGLATWRRRPGGGQ